MTPLKKTINPFSLEDEILLCENFTNTYKSHACTNIHQREIACLSVQYPACFCAPQTGDLFVGRNYHPLVQFSPQPGYNSLGYCIDPQKLKCFESDDNLTPNLKAKLDNISTFWLKEETREYIKAEYPNDVKNWLKSDDYFNYRAVAHPLYRISGTQLDYDKLLSLGVDGLQQLISKKEAYADKHSSEFYSAMHKSLTLFSNIILDYSHKIINLINTTENEAWKVELNEMKDSLLRLSHAPAHSFRDAIQLTYLWWIFSGSRNFSRMDTYLSDYYVNDVKNNVITEDRALELLCGLWQLIDMEHFVYDSRVVIGGKGRENEANANLFCKLAINATRKVRTVVPQLALRYYSGMDNSVLDLAYTAIGEGCTFPMLYNDDINIPAVSNAFCVSEELAQQYCPYGCGEYVLDHQSIGTPSGIINLTKALEVTLNNGKDMETMQVLGLDLGNLTTFDTFDDLLCAYKKQVEHFVKLLAKVEELEYIHAGKHCSFLSFSMLFDDCISRGRALLDGGIRYLGGTLESYGNVNAADSLTAIKTLIYDEKKYTKIELLDALKSNFKEYPELRKDSLNCPKYGNEHETADSMLVHIHEHICDFTRKCVKDTIMHNYLIVVINNDANTVLGHLTSASADGRLSGLHLANANNPQGGADKNGLTSMLNSIVKPPIHHHAGSVQNLKLNKEMFSNSMLPVTKSLIDTYMKKGGAQLMITVVSPKELEDALVHPENHQNLIVRVGGFSAKFVELGSDVQQELLSRSLHG